MDDLFQMFGELIGEAVFGAAVEVATDCEYRPLTCLAPGPEILSILPHPSEHTGESQGGMVESNDRVLDYD